MRQELIKENKIEAYFPADRLPVFFICISLVFLFVGLLFGVLSGFQYIFPDWLRNIFPFTRMRTLHVSLVISWIFTASTGGIYYFVQDYLRKPLFSPRLAWSHLALLVFVSSCTFVNYFLGKFGGREYLEFPAWIGLPIIAYWILFMINYFKTISGSFSNAPVYVWMWATGLIFFLITFLESQLWLLDFFGGTIIRDTTVQWKALGSMVGSWNMLVYGTAFYIMEKIIVDTKVAQSRQTFFFYFLGLTNLMFNWGHHTYIVPASPWIKHISYFISMTELLILANIIREWRLSFRKAKINFHIIPYRFLTAADLWIFLNLILAIAMSVPAINAYTHGTHITVAHAMGTTIGINSMILFAALTFIANKIEFLNMKRIEKWMLSGYWVVNVSLMIFWLALLIAGAIMSGMKDLKTHQEIMLSLSPLFRLVATTGLILLLGFSMLIFPLLKLYLKKIFDKMNVVS